MVAKLTLKGYFARSVASLTFAVKWDLVSEVGEGGYIEYPPLMTLPDPILPLFFVLTPL
jgi:hypothetical protein